MAAQKGQLKPYLPVSYTDNQVRIIQALHRGDATPEMQREALRFIIEEVAGAYDLPYYPDDRDTAFACGKQFVGKQLVKMTKLIVARLNPEQG